MEHQLQLRIPCWVVVDATADDLTQALNIVIMQSNGRSFIQVFLEKSEAERLIKEAGLTGRIPLTIPTIGHLSRLMEHLQQQGVHEVQIFFQAGNEFKRASVPIGDFNDGLRKHLGTSGSDGGKGERFTDSSGR